MIRSSARSRQRTRAAQERGDRILHHVGALFSLSGQGTGNAASQAAASGPMRRRRQRRNMVRRLLDPLPAGLRPETHNQEKFWSWLRWGGAGLILGWLLSR